MQSIKYQLPAANPVVVYRGDGTAALSVNSKGWIVTHDAPRYVFLKSGRTFHSDQLAVTCEAQTPPPPEPHTDLMIAVYGAACMGLGLAAAWAIFSLRLQRAAQAWPEHVKGSRW